MLKNVEIILILLLMLADKQHSYIPDYLSLLTGFHEILHLREKFEAKIPENAEVL